MAAIEAKAISKAETQTPSFMESERLAYLDMKAKADAGTLHKDMKKVAAEVPGLKAPKAAKSAQVNYPTTKMSTEKAGGLKGEAANGNVGGKTKAVMVQERPLSSPNYSVVYETKLQQGKHYPGVKDTIHFQESNKQLYNVLSANPEFKILMESSYPGITKAVTPGPRGAFLPTSPTKAGLTWHHNTYEPGVMELVPKKHHSAGGAVQKTLHPKNKGGMQTWGGGRNK